MKKTEKWMPLAAFAALVLGATSCEDWGQQDPLAGNQTYPTKELVATHDFEAEEGLDPMVYTLTANQAGQVPQVTDDETKGKVLELCGGSYVTLANPLNNVALQKAASLTFWMYQPIVTADADGNEVEYVQDIISPIISFVGEEVKDTPVEGDESGEGGSPNEGETETRGTGSPVTGTLYITANGEINYSATNGKWSENNPSEATTGYMTPGEWHYVAVVIRDDGFEWYVDGNRKVTKTVPNFDMSKLVALANNAQTVVLGSADSSNTLLLDDITFYRNAIDSKETQRPNLGGGTSGGNDLVNFEYVIGEPLFNVGQPDCSSAWWTDFSNYYRIPANTTMNFEFINHTSGGGNWNNWNLCVSTDADRGGDGYAEYFVIRSDLYGWGDAYNGDNWSNEGYGDWDKFLADMEGAVVNVTVARTGTTTNVTAKATAADGTVYIERFFAETGNETDVMRAFFIVDGSYLEFNKDKCYASWGVPVATPSIGAEDCSAAWWTEFSDYFSIPAGQSLHLGFTNYTSGGGNWNNWNLCVSTDADRGGDGYAEYFVIRSDLYGWGDAYNGDNWSNEGYGDWDKFLADMNGAYVDINIVRQAETAFVTADALAADGSRYIERFNAVCGDASQTLRAFLIVDGSHLKMNTPDCYLYVPVYK